MLNMNFRKINWKEQRIEISKKIITEFSRMRNKTNT